MKVSSEMKGSRLNMRETAELVGMHEAHFRRLVRRGVFPSAKRTSKGNPFFDHGLLVQVAAVMRGRIGMNGEEIMFYNRNRSRSSAKRVAKHPTGNGDAYLTSLADGLRQLGIEGIELQASRLASLLTAEFGQERPALELALPVIARRLLERQS